MLKARISSSANDTPPAVPLPAELTYIASPVTGVIVAVGVTAVTAAVLVVVGNELGVDVFDGTEVATDVIVGIGVLVGNDILVGVDVTDKPEL